MIAGIVLPGDWAAKQLRAIARSAFARAPTALLGKGVPRRPSLILLPSDECCKKLPPAVNGSPPPNIQNLADSAASIAHSGAELATLSTASSPAGTIAISVGCGGFGRGGDQLPVA